MPDELTPEQFLRGDLPETPDIDPHVPEVEPAPIQRGPSHVYQEDSPRPAPQPEPTPEPAPIAPQQDPRIDSLQQTVNALLYAQAQPRYQQQQPQPQHVPTDPYKPWEGKEFLSKEDAVALLTAQDPAQFLNRTFNTVAESVYNPMLEQLRQRDALIAQMNAGYQQQTVRQQQEQLAQRNVQNFYTRHPEIQEFQDLVPLEVDAIARESQTNPAAFVNRTDQDIYDILAQRVLQRVERYRGATDPGTTDLATPAPVQRTTLERGGGTRPGQKPKPRDSNALALHEMVDHIRNG